MIQSQLSDLSKYTRCHHLEGEEALSTYASCMRLKCNQLKVKEVKNKFVYDWAIRSRFDFAINVRILLRLNNNKLHIPNCRMTPEDFGNDQFLFLVKSDEPTLKHLIMIIIMMKHTNDV